eukprot:865766-Prorocentrum_minimum.AAC.2
MTPSATVELHSDLGDAAADVHLPPQAKDGGTHAGLLASGDGRKHIPGVTCGQRGHHHQHLRVGGGGVH